MAYCHACGRFADLDPAAMCAACRAAWRPSAGQADDLGIRGGDSHPASSLSVLRRAGRSVLSYPDTTANVRQGACMTIATVTVCDAIHANIGHLPKGPAAGYSTGTGVVPWTDADWRAHPGAVRICQNPGATDTTADVLDVEAGAATIGVCARWAEAAAASVAAGKRPGQRHPAIYMSLSMVTPVVNALIAGGIHSGVSLWVANWNLTAAEATVLVAHAAGPWPIIGVQYGNRGTYDVSVFSRPWLDAVSGDPAKPPPAKFHGEWVTKGQLSLAQLAATFGLKPSNLLRMTAVHYGQFGPELASYLNAVHNGTLRPNSPLPAGSVLWVD